MQWTLKAIADKLFGSDEAEVVQAPVMPVVPTAPAPAPAPKAVETPKPKAPKAPKIQKDETVKHRRLKDNGVSKLSRLERALCPSDRDIIILWWNENQRLVDKDDPICQTLADQINACQPHAQPLCALQVAGYLSHLCRLGRNPDRDMSIVRAMEKGSYSIEPRFSTSLLVEIEENYRREREEERKRAEEHARIRAARDEKRAEVLRRRAKREYETELKKNETVEQMDILSILDTPKPAPAQKVTVAQSAPAPVKQKFVITWTSI